MIGETRGASLDAVSPELLVSYLDGRREEGCSALVLVPDDRWFAELPRDANACASIRTERGSMVVYSGPPADAVSAVRAAAAMKLQACILLDTGLHTGGDGDSRPILVSDHINLTGRNPLTGPNIDSWGVRFPDMTEPYDPQLRAAAATHGSEGIAAGFLEPPLPQDLAVAAEFGANVATLGIVAPAIAARHAGMRLMAVLFVGDVPSAEEVLPILEAAARVLSG